MSSLYALINKEDALFKQKKRRLAGNVPGLIWSRLTRLEAKSSWLNIKKINRQSVYDRI